MQVQDTIRAGARSWQLGKLIGLAGVLAVLMTALGLSRPSHRAEAATPPTPYHWDIEAYTQDWVISGFDGYAIRNALMTTGEPNFLRSGHQTAGINLAYGDYPATPNIAFERASGGAIQYGDKVAIHVDGLGYLKYGSRTFGVSLVPSAIPVYEWQVYGEDKAIGAIMQAADATRVALYNATTSRYLVWGYQFWGIDLDFKTGAPPSPPPPPTTGTVLLGLRYQVPPGQTFCSGASFFRLTPLNVSDDDVARLSQTEYTTDENRTPHADGYCYWHTSTIDLPALTWQIDAFWGYVHEGSCQLPTGTGLMSALFTADTPGCGTAGYP
jgi:hypothetical protein